jgi:hypothetical protein
LDNLLFLQKMGAAERNLLRFGACEKVKKKRDEQKGEKEDTEMGVLKVESGKSKNQKKKESAYE